MLDNSRSLRNRPVYIPEVGMYFRDSFAPEHEASARRMAEVHGLTVEPFGFKLKTAAPSPLTWEKVEGWSTWAEEAASDWIGLIEP